MGYAVYRHHPARCARCRTGTLAAQKETGIKKQTRNLCIAAAAFIVLGGAYIALVGQQTEEEETVAIEELTDLDVTDLTYTNTEGTWHLTKTDDAWSYADDAACPIDSTAVQEFVDEIEKITAGRKLDNPDADADYGLDAPDYTMELSDGSQTVTVTASVQDSVTYLKANDAVYATTAYLPEGLDQGLKGWIEYENIPYATEDSLTEIVWGDTTVTRVLEEEAASADESEASEASDSEDETEEEEITKWQITDASGTRTIEQDSPMDTFLNAVRNLCVLSCADYGVTDTARKQPYGLEAPQTLKVSYTTEDGIASYTITIGASDGNGGYYAMLDDNGIVLVLEAEGVDTLRSVDLSA